MLKLSILFALAVVFVSLVNCTEPPPIPGGLRWSLVDDLVGHIDVLAGFIPPLHHALQTARPV